MGEMTRISNTQPARGERGSLAPWRTAAAVRVAALLLLALLLAACGSSTADEETGDGQLQVNVTAPEGVTPRMVLRGPDARSWVITETTLLQDLVPGTYVLRAESVIDDGQHYVPAPPQWQGEIHDLHEGELPPSVSVAYVRSVQPNPPDTEPDPTPIREGSKAYHIDCNADDDSASGLGA